MGRRFQIHACELESDSKPLARLFQHQNSTELISTHFYANLAFLFYISHIYNLVKLS